MKNPFTTVNVSKFIPKPVVSAVSRQSLVVKKHSPTILLTAGLVGFGATIVMSSRATLKLDDVLKAHAENEKAATELFESGNDEYPESDYRSDRIYIWSRTAVALGKLYGPSIVLGAASTACIIGSHNILNTRNASLAAAYKAAETAYSRYQARVAQEFGEDKAREFRYDVVKEETKDEDGETVETTRVSGRHTPSMYARFFDELNPNFNRSDHQLNRMFLSCQERYANDLLIARGHVFLNEVYDMLGMERTTAGQVVGWVVSSDGTDNYVDFGIFDSDNIEKRMFVNGDERAVLLDFNVNGVVYDLIEKN